MRHFNYISFQLIVVFNYHTIVFSQKTFFNSHVSVSNIILKTIKNNFTINFWWKVVSLCVCFQFLETSRIKPFHKTSVLMLKTTPHSHFSDRKSRCYFHLLLLCLFSFLSFTLIFVYLDVLLSTYLLQYPCIFIINQVNWWCEIIKTIIGFLNRRKCHYFSGEIS